MAAYGISPRLGGGGGSFHTMAMQHSNQAIGSRSRMQPSRETELAASKSIGGALSSGIGGAAAGSAIAKGVSTGASAGAWGAAIGAGVSLLSYMMS